MPDLPLLTPSRRVSGKSDHKHPQLNYANEENRETLEYMRVNLPNTIVNIMGVFKGKLPHHDTCQFTNCP